jgi:hypothetical protein
MVQSLTTPPLGYEQSIVPEKYVRNLYQRVRGVIEKSRARSVTTGRMDKTTAHNDNSVREYIVSLDDEQTSKDCQVLLEMMRRISGHEQIVQQSYEYVKSRGGHMRRALE